MADSCIITYAMQKCVTLELAESIVTRERSGWLVPWQTCGYGMEYQLSELSGGVFDLSDWGIVAVRGRDAEDFLHRLSTADVKNFSNGNVYHGALLTGRATPVAFGFFTKDVERFDLLLSPGQGDATRSHLEKLHFSESLTISDRSADWALFALWIGPRFYVETKAPLTWTDIRISSHTYRCFQDDQMPRLIWLLLPRDKVGELYTDVAALGLSFFGRALFDYMRIEAKVPTMGCEVTEDTLVLEANLERTLCRTKGCYPGQEVVERIYSYGSVNRKLMGITIKTTGQTDLPTCPYSLAVNAKPVGEVVSEAVHPLDARLAYGLSYIYKDYLQYDGVFESSEPAIQEIRLR